MWGFKPLDGSQNLIKHRNKLHNKLPTKYHEELDCVYDWVSDLNFQNALKCNTVEQWKYCKNTMENAPELYIDKRIVLAGNNDFKYDRIEFSSKVGKPKCRICDHDLCEDVDSKCKYIILSCPCGRMYCHTKCADTYLLKTPTCFVCKTYFIYDRKNSTLRSTFAHR
jgi:hypothetical protein